MSNHTAVVGCPSLHSMIRLRANSSVMGPLVPSDTVRRYQKVAGIAAEGEGAAGDGRIAGERTSVHISREGERGLGR